MRELTLPQVEQILLWVALAADGVVTKEELIGRLEFVMDAKFISFGIPAGILHLVSGARS